MGAFQFWGKIESLKNRFISALINEVHRYRCSVLTLSGDAITCWFDDDLSSLPPSGVAGEAGLRATACGLAISL
jgi:hypothetical protein